MAVGQGLAALGFWIFLAAVVVAGIWYGVRERQARYETLRRILDSGQPVDQALMAQLLPPSGGDSRRLERDLKVGGLIVLFVAAGLALLGWFIGMQSAQWLLPMLGVAALVGCVGTGLVVTSNVVGRSYGKGNAPASDKPRA
ncbi:MAG TPA: DUF6249 domain-containing protein [bacterium]|nr:DUF6249 domain-containing protein [bacterium]